MKAKQLILTSIVCLLCATGMMAQSSDGVLEYKRNSLALTMVYHSEDEFGTDIFEAWDSIPFPDKFDNHNLGSARVMVADSISGAKKKGEKGLYKAKYGHTVLTQKEMEANAQAIEDLLNEAQVGKEMVAKWFSLQGSTVDDATFSTELIQARGQYNASDVDVEKAMLTARGVATLADAGEELIGQTFLVVNDMTYITAEQRAAATKATMAVLGGLFDAVVGGNSGRNIANATGKIADSFTGFKVITNSYLYRLEWNDSIAAIFYNEYYTSTPNREKIQAFWANDSLFRVKFVAHEREFAEKTEVKGKYDRKELVKMECTRSIDKNIAQLQLKYEDFKVKTPVYAVEADAKGKTVYTAKIGMKEGVTDKSSYQVVQRIIDPETNRTTYKYVATVKPVKGQIWDNRYNAVLEQDKGSELTRTQFKKVGGGEILPGMLLIEGKYSKIKE